MPRSSSWRRTSAKCVAHSAQRWSAILGSVLDRRLVLGHLAVEHAQRVAVGPALAVAAHRGAPRSRRAVAQPLDVGRAAGAVAATEFRTSSCSRTPAGVPGSRSASSIVSASIVGLVEAEGLDVDLVELPVAALLRPLAAEHRAHRVDASARDRSFVRLCSIPRAPRRPCASGRRVSEPPSAVGRTCTSPSRRCPSRPRCRARTARSPRRSACGSRGSRSGRRGPAPPPRSRARPRSRRAGCRGCP